jgi:tRNA dimethylallyltransferase
VDSISPTVLVLVGPTGVGKTAVSIQIAKKIECELVSADSRQVYRQMDIGTSKPSKEYLESVPHHFINILNPDKDYSAGQYAREARKVVHQIRERRKIPLVVGGSGLYIRALLNGFFGEDYRDESIRLQLNARLKDEGAASLYSELQHVDPQSADQTHPNNIKRVLRSLEVYYITGNPISEIQKSGEDPAAFPWIKFGLIMKRESLYERINHRVEQMFKSGLMTEVQDLLNNGYSPKLNSLNSVGYKEVIEYLNSNLDLENCISLVKQNTRRYAKRQLTWFRRETDIHWETVESEKSLASEIAEDLLRKYNSITAKGIN